MSRSKRQKYPAGCDIDMTPMIDVVFQLIIFFIVTITLTQKYNEEITLERGPHGETIDSGQSSRNLTIEVDKTGRLSIHNVRLSYPQMRDIVHGRYNRMGQFPVLIRADRDTRHEYVRAVMNICTEAGIGRVSFVAIQQETTGS